MFTDMHLLDATRLTTLAPPFPYYLFLTIPFLYLFTQSPAAYRFRPLPDRLASNKRPSPTRNSPVDQPFLLGILAGTFVLLQSNLANMVYLSAGLLYSALAHHPL